MYRKDTHRLKALSNKIPALRKSMNKGKWVVGTSNQISSLQEILKLKQKFRKNKAVTGKIPFFAIAPFFISLTLASGKTSLYGNVPFSIVVFLT